MEQHDPDPTKARLHALYRFVMDNGRLPKVHEQQEGVAVGFWAEQCRQQHQQQQLDHDLAAALQSVQGWDWQPQTQALSAVFEQGLRFVQQYQAMHRGRLPKTRTNKRSSTTELESNATAVCRQLMEQRRRGVLTQQQIDHVSNTLRGWRWDARVRAPPLNEMIQLLQDFVQRHGRLPRQYERLPNGFLLGEWCAMRRREYAHGELETDVADALSNGVPGWCWNLGDTAFEHNLEMLKQFVAVEGRIPAQREEHGGVRIGAWCNKRRLQYKQGSMPPDRIAALEAVDGWWWTADGMPEE
uniref:Helicase-associated domain-containing protein n=1 Tax=Tetradesmus obliquus TaxID=3088 RepID=A0A383VYY7_TETOB|eukprot:jgi/Sobl393_1/19775/SZX70052.1